MSNWLTDPDTTDEELEEAQEYCKETQRLREEAEEEEEDDGE